MVLSYDPGLMYSLRRPPEGLTGFLLLIWPLIFVQLVALKRWVRAKYGPGVPYWYGVTGWGRVYLRHLPTDFTWSCAAPGALRPIDPEVLVFARSPRLALALAPETCAVPVPARAILQPSVHVLSRTVFVDTS